MTLVSKLVRTVTKPSADVRLKRLLKENASVGSLLNPISIVA